MPRKKAGLIQSVTEIEVPAETAAAPEAMTPEQAEYHRLYGFKGYNQQTPTHTYGPAHATGTTTHGGIATTTQHPAADTTDHL